MVFVHSDTMITYFTGFSPHPFYAHLGCFLGSPVDQTVKTCYTIPVPEREFFVMKTGLLKKITIFSKPLGLGLIGLLVIFGSYIIQPKTAAAFSLNFFSPFDSGQTDSLLSFGQLPSSNDAEPIRVLKQIPITAYSSEVGQTDSTPFITASGTTVRHGVVAANFLPIGTRVRFPELYGEQVFIVEDRMNARYYQRFDIWMEETADARNFGVHWTTVEVF